MANVMKFLYTNLRNVLASMRNEEIKYRRILEECQGKCEVRGSTSNVAGDLPLCFSCTPRVAAQEDNDNDDFACDPWEDVTVTGRDTIFN